MSLYEGLSLNPQDCHKILGVVTHTEDSSTEVWIPADPRVLQDSHTNQNREFQIQVETMPQIRRWRGTGQDTRCQP